MQNGITTYVWHTANHLPSKKKKIKQIYCNLLCQWIEERTRIGEWTTAEEKNKMKKINYRHIEENDTTGCPQSSWTPSHFCFIIYTGFIPQECSCNLRLETSRGRWTSLPWCKGHLVSSKWTHWLFHAIFKPCWAVLNVYNLNVFLEIICYFHLLPDLYSHIIFAFLYSSANFTVIF